MNHRHDAKFVKCAGTLLLLVLTGGRALAAEPGMSVADNSGVLQLWAQETGASSAPELVPAGDGGTRLEWKNGVSLDYYRNSSSGGFLLTPIRDENTNYSVQLQTEAKANWRGDELSWFTFGGSASDDRAVLDHPAMISSLQLGHAGEAYRVALGDVPVNFSTLGANIGLRGVQGERLFSKTMVHAVAGVQSETWEALSDRERRSRYLRNAYAVKIDHALTDTLNVYLTNQGYSDDADSTTAAVTALATSEGRTTTAGLAFQQGRFTVNAEGGVSDWEEDGVQDENDHAWILDAGWQGERIGIQAGHHDLGLYYTSLSGTALSGVEESYGSATWMTNEWLSFNGDLRHTENERALPPGMPPGMPPVNSPYTPNAFKTDSFTLGSNMQLLALPGLSLQVQRSQSDGRNEDGGGNDLDDTAFNLQYSRESWSAGVGFQRSEIENSAAPLEDSESDTWNYFLSRQWVEPVNGTWNVSATVMYSDQRQNLDYGARTSNDNYTLSVSGQHVRWGQLSAMWYDSRVRDPATGQNYDQWGMQIDAQRSLGKYGAIKLYFAKNDSFSENSAIAYKERTLGLQVLSGF